ncbi:hypothetical protein EWM64_g6917 [Hericium alpestre]|uniref:Alpha-ketoglutarate-dependent dioxygenase AlkB-like domain-containing protein n=1 Tax=Hericium alpestre TaxID=135208 RepID=A0A4Y9ZQB8_9AGAM|nr:hypothetical protein EWM64_g6917 [Hericium alpestre]
MDLLDPTSVADKKARRQHWKATKNRPKDVEAEWTPFRAAEKKFMARFPPPDLGEVLDLNAEDIESGWKGHSQGIQFKEVAFNSENERKRAFVQPQIPASSPHTRSAISYAGRLHHKPVRQTRPTSIHTTSSRPPDSGTRTSTLCLETSPDEIIQPHAPASPDPLPASQPPTRRQLIANPALTPESYAALANTPKPPPAPSPTAPALPASQLIRKLRWANIGWYYHWGTKMYDFARGPGVVDGLVREVCREVVGGVRWDEVFEGEALEGWDDDREWEGWKENYEPDAGIVNFYQTKDTLMGHVDRSEVCTTSPLVSISLGNAAIFLVGGHTRDVPPIPILLRSGDVVIMSGPACRRAYHG